MTEDKHFIKLLDKLKQVEVIEDISVKLSKLETIYQELKAELIERRGEKFKNGEDVSLVNFQLNEIEGLIERLKKHKSYKGVEQLEIYINKMVKIYNEKHPVLGEMIVISDSQDTFYFPPEEAEYLSEQLLVLVAQAKQNELEEK
ncbi:hypothetical protein ABEY43_07360 [Priestia megaterium]